LSERNTLINSLGIIAVENITYSKNSIKNYLIYPVFNYDLNAI